MSKRLPRSKAILGALGFVGIGLAFTVGDIAALLGWTTRPALFYSLPAVINFAMG